MLMIYIDDPRPKSEALPRLSDPRIVEGSVHAKVGVPDIYVGEAVFKSTASGAPTRTEFTVYVPTAAGGRPAVTLIRLLTKTETVAGAGAQASQSRPTPAAPVPAVDADQLKTAVTEFVTSRMKKDGAFVVPEPKGGADRRLVMLNVKPWTRTRIGDKLFRVCVDFSQSNPRQTADVDFYVGRDDGGRWAVKSFVLHKAEASPPALGGTRTSSGPPAVMGGAGVPGPGMRPEGSAFWRERVAPSTAPCTGAAMAQLAPPPGNPAPGFVWVYGVAYDLVTKCPVKNATLTFGGGRSVTTDEHGWYQMNLHPPAMEIDFELKPTKSGYVGCLQETEPPLAGQSLPRRRAAAEAGSASFMFRLDPNVHIAELNVAMIPDTWPADIPEVGVPDFSDPPEPPAPNYHNVCRLYGVLYDLSTIKPICRKAMVLSWKKGSIKVFTDGLGRFAMDAPNYSHAELDASLDGYLQGLTADRDPPLRTLSAKQRREIAGQIDLGPIEIPDVACDGVLRFDLVAIPKGWQ